MKPIEISGMMAFLLVKYPYRQSKDCYIMAEGHPVFCVQCEKEMTAEEVCDHIRYHDKRKGEADIIAIKNGKTCTITGLTTKRQEMPV